MSNNQCNVCGGPVDSGGMCQGDCVKYGPRCPACGTFWYAHSGPIAMCHRIESLYRENAELRAELNTVRAKQ